MKISCAIVRCLSILLLAAAAPAHGRSWTGADGQPVEADYMSSTMDTVTIRRPDGQAFRLPLATCSQEDRDFVAQKQAEELAANSIDATVTGEIIWKLPSWNNLSWSNRQNSELWSCDEKTGKPVAKVADLPVTYDSEIRRNEFSGQFASATPLRLPKSGRYVIRGIFRCTVDREEKSVEQFSAPFSLPQVSKGILDLHTVRFTRLK